MSNTVFLNDEVMVATHAANAFYAAHMGSPLCLDQVLAKLLRAGSPVYQQLLNIVTGAQQLNARLRALADDVLNAHGVEGQSSSESPEDAILSEEAILSRIGSIPANDETAYLAFGHAAMLDANVLNAPNSGAQMVAINGQRVPVYAQGNVQQIRGISIIKLASGRRIELVTFTKGHGALISYLHACILNLQTLRACDDVAANLDLVARIDSLIADVSAYQAQLWTLAPAIKALGDARFSMPGVPLANRPRGGIYVGWYLSIVWRYPA